MVATSINFECGTINARFDYLLLHCTELNGLFQERGGVVQDLYW